MAQLELSNLLIHFSGAKAVQNVSIRVEQGEFRGLIGPNGTDKTTVFNAITGVVQPMAGDVYFGGQRLDGIHTSKIAHMGITRIFQDIRIYPKMTTVENVAIGLDSYPSYSALSVMLRPSYVVKRDREIKRFSLEYLDKVGILEYEDYGAGALPYGLQRKLKITHTLATKPKFLFLNEPAAGMNANGSIELVSFLKNLHQNNDGLTIVLIEHHPGVVMKACQDINVFNLGTMLAPGTPDEIQRGPDVVKACLGERRKRNGK